MMSHNIVKEKADLLEKQALLLLPREKQNIQSAKRILSINQWFINDVEINILETDTVSSAFLLAQKWPFTLLEGSKPIVYAFMAGNDTLSKRKSLESQKTPKTLLNLMLLFETEEEDQPLISMLAANCLLECLKNRVQSKEAQILLKIRWKHDILVQMMKVGEISLKQVKVEDRFYSQLSNLSDQKVIEVNVKSIPRNFGAYDFQPTFLQKHTKSPIDISELAQAIMNNLVQNIWTQQAIHKRSQQIKSIYQNELIYMNQKVTIYDRNYEHIHYTGKFLGIDEQGNAVLEGHKKVFTDGLMKFDSQAKDYLSLYRGSY